MPRKVDHEARREDFLKAAGRLIRRDGFAGLTVRAVASEAGYTTGALVHYVDSIDELLLDAFEFASRAVRVRMLEAEADPDPLMALRGVLFLTLPNGDAQLENWTYWLGFWERSAQNRTLREATHTRYVAWIKRVGRLIRRAKQAGRIAPDVDVAGAARAGVALIDGLAAQVLRSGRPPTVKEQRAIVNDWIRFWLRPVEARRPPRKPRARS